MQLIYVDKHYLNIVDLTEVGGPPKSYQFVVVDWSNGAIKVVLAADEKTDGSFGRLQLLSKHAANYSFFGEPDNFRKWMDVNTSDSCTPQMISNVENLVGQFVSGMTGLLGNWVHEWTALSPADCDEVGRQFRSFVGDSTPRATSVRDRYEYNSSQEFHDNQENVFDEGGQENEEIEPADDVQDAKVDMDKENEGDDDAQGATSCGGDAQTHGQEDTESDRAGEIREAQVDGGVGGSGIGGSAVPPVASADDAAALKRR